MVNPLGLVLDPSLDVIELRIGDLGLLMDLLSQALEFLQSRKSTKTLVNNCQLELDLVDCDHEPWWWHGG